jgi:uncharacterized membrane protein
MKKTVLSLALAAAIGHQLLPAVATAQTPQVLPKYDGLYSIVADINNSGLIVGGAIDLTNGNSIAVQWNNGTISTLTTPTAFTWSSATAVNDKGMIVGGGCSESGDIQPIEWINGLPIPLETKGLGGYACDINNAGDIVGYVNTEQFTAPALWRNGQMIIMPSLYEAGGIATGIDDQGRIVGTSQGVNDALGSQVPTQWLNNLPTALPLTFGQDYIGVLGVNRTGGGGTSGYVIERKALDGDPLGYLITVAVGWQDGEFRELQNPAGSGNSVAYGVNASGLYAGYTTAPENGPRIPTIWDKEGPTTLPLDPDREAIAVAVNDNGLVVGIDTTDRRNPTPVLWRLNNTPTIELANIQATPSQTVTLQARIIQNGRSVPNQTLNFQVNGKSLASAKSDASGVAKLAYKVPSSPKGNQVVTASLGGGKSVVRSIVVGKSDTVAAITPARAKKNQAVTLKATLRAKEANIPLANRKLKFVIRGKTVGSATTSSRGITSMTYQVPATTPVTTIPIEVRYPGDTQNSAVVGRASLSVIR